MSNTNISLRANNFNIDVISNDGESFLLELGNNGKRKTVNISFKEEAPKPVLSEKDQSLLYTAHGYLKIISEVPEVNLKIRFAADLYQLMIDNMNFVNNRKELKEALINKAIELKKDLTYKMSYDYSDKLLRLCDKILGIDKPYKPVDVEHEDRKDLMRYICQLKDIRYSDNLMDEYYKWSSSNINGNGKHLNRFKKMNVFLQKRRV
jgi:hypothetical protein